MSRGAFRNFISEQYGNEFNSPSAANNGPALPPRPLPVQPPLPQVDGREGPVTVGALPDFSYASNIRPGHIRLPELLVDSLLHRGCKLMLAGGSKSFKSWCLIDLGISIAHGMPWWGMSCRQGRVLYLNFELIDGFFEERLVSICSARQCPLPQNFLYWNLRGHCYDLAVLAKVILSRLELVGPIDLVIVDPVYKALGDLDENSASDMTKLMNLIESITVQTGASIAFGSHFSKGNQSSKEAKDRPSGSGVLIRDPDAILTMTRHQEEGCYVVNTELRYLPPMPEFVTRWTFPIMQADESLDPRQLYQPGKVDGPTGAGNSNVNAFSDQDVLDCLPRTGAQDTLWRKHVALRFGRSGQEYYSAKSKLLAAGQVVKQGLKYYPTALKFEQQKS